MTVSTEIKQRRLELLEETAAHFNSTNRSTNKDGGCNYYPVNSNSEGCAIGRKIADKEICKLLDSRGHYIHRNDAFNLLPKELQELGQEFLKRLQNLHDSEGFWDEKGLTEAGLLYKDYMIKSFCSDKQI